MVLSRSRASSNKEEKATKTLFRMEADVSARSSFSSNSFLKFFGASPSSAHLLSHLQSRNTTVLVSGGHEDGHFGAIPMVEVQHLSMVH